MDLQTLYYAIAALLVLVGIAGTILPALPGLPLVFAGMLLGAWAGHFEYIGVPVLVVLGVLTMLSLAVDFWATALGAKRVGASGKAVAGAVIGTFVGIFFGPVGLFAGPFIGALAGELLHGRDVGRATRVGFGTWLGVVFGTVLKLALAFTMVGLFVLAWVF
ncbi:DUF456 domain-containing protein [Luteimonas sp. MC1750]|uniref:DUF456 domain-containing protein n=1 Tax=Luteimonas sp. MC1750 TaxID=2799326 RepID=UPI0018F0D579|nr:DUF456 domain-containing protein [Luteimonas sp. MC1750]MBJ6984149.1 DUF456 domain-containing protein [Luteimonas sp. MC1750]QQO06951.1 DUF456 domain-containing protein [Luteimonas sp. MC1750]